MTPTTPAPAATTAVAEPKPLVKNPQSGKAFGSHELQCAKEVRILILDDDLATCQVMEAALTAPDFIIKAVSEPDRMEEALKTAPNEEYQLIVLDYVLPGLEAEQVFGWLHDHQPEASIIVVTGYPTIDSALQCLRNRTYDYLTKPFQVAQLRKVVMHCLEGRGLLRMSEEALRETLGNAIRERRKGMGLTLAHMAQRTEVSLGYLSQIELGKNSASIETLYRICLALGIRMAELFSAVQKGA